MFLEMGERKPKAQDKIKQDMYTVSQKSNTLHLAP